MGHADDYICEPDTVIIGRKGNINNPIYVDEAFWNVDTAFRFTSKKKEVLNPRYLFYFCKKNMILRNLIKKWLLSLV